MYAHGQAPYSTFSTPTFNHRWSIQSALWMLMHGNEPADQQFFTVYHGQKQEEDKFKKKKKKQRKQGVCGWSGGVISSFIHVVLWQCEASDIPCIHNAALRTSGPAVFIFLLEIRLTVPLAEMIATVSVILHPEISFKNGGLIREHCFVGFC